MTIPSHIAANGDNVVVTINGKPYYRNDNPEVGKIEYTASTFGESDIDIQLTSISYISNQFVGIGGGALCLSTDGKDFSISIIVGNVNIKQIVFYNSNYYGYDTTKIYNLGNNLNSLSVTGSPITTSSVINDASSNADGSIAAFVGNNGFIKIWSKSIENIVTPILGANAVTSVAVLNNVVTVVYSGKLYYGVVDSNRVVFKLVNVIYNNKSVSNLAFTTVKYLSGYDGLVAVGTNSIAYSSDGKTFVESYAPITHSLVDVASNAKHSMYSVGSDNKVYSLTPIAVKP